MIQYDADRRHQSNSPHYFITPASISSLSREAVITLMHHPMKQYRLVCSLMYHVPRITHQPALIHQASNSILLSSRIKFCPLNEGICPHPDTFSPIPRACSSSCNSSKGCLVCGSFWTNSLQSLEEGLPELLLTSSSCSSSPAGSTSKYASTNSCDTCTTTSHACSRSQWPSPPCPFSRVHLPLSAV